MIKTYRKIITGIFIVGAVLGILGLVLQYGVFLGIRANKTERNNSECTLTERVFDEAGRLSEKQEESLEELIAGQEQIIGADIVLVTIEESDIDSYEEIRDYAQTYYEEHNFGWNGPNGDGIIYVDNWATGYTWLCTTGTAAEKLDSDSVDYIVDRTNEIVNENAYEAYRLMVNTVVQEMQSMNMFHLNISPLWVLAIALIIAIVFAGIQLSGHGGRKTVGRSTYVGEEGVHINTKQDIFFHSHVVRRRIETHDHDHGGGGHGGGHIGGSGGHGGGGGRH